MNDSPKLVKAPAQSTLRKHRLIIIIDKILENIQISTFLTIAHPYDLASGSTNGGRGSRCLKTIIIFAFPIGSEMTIQLERSLNQRYIIVPIYHGTQQFAWPYRLKIHAAAGGEVLARLYNELCHISMAQQRLWLSHVTFHSPQQPLRAPVNHQEVRTAPPSHAYSGFTDSSGRLEASMPY